MTYPVRGALRLPVILFFLLTAWFGLLSYIPFAYLQFLRHLLFGWLEFFVLFHHWLFWSAFLLALLSIADDLAARRPAAWAFAALFGMAGIWLWLHPVLPGLGNDWRSLVVGLIALVAPAWLAAIDHLAARGRITWRLQQPLQDGITRELRACLWTAVYVWASFALIAAARILRAHDQSLSGAEHLLAVGWSLPLHIAFAAAGFVFVAAVYLVARHPRSQYTLIMAGIAAAGWVVLTWLVFPSIAFRGLPAHLIAILLGAWGAFVWSGLAMCRVCDVGRGVSRAKSDLKAHTTSLDIAVSPFSVSRRLAAVSLAALVVIACAAVEGIAKADWYFLFQKLIACVVWLAGFAIVYNVSRSGGRAFAPVVMAVSLVIVLGTLLIAGAAPSSKWEFAIERYAPYDASLALIDHFAKPKSTGLADVTKWLVEQSDLEATGAQPVSIDFVKPLKPSGARRPHIFLFVVDSLRRDYLSPYNREVSFTPAIQSFASESIVFTRAFTRYSGTGLSEPAIWSGALLPHKQYVTPFAPMNALEKLLNAEGYRRLISVDSILKGLLTPSSAMHELDAGVQNRLYDSCRTLDEIRAVLPDTLREGNPLFAFTQSQDIHLANVAVDQSRRAGPAYGRFYAPYAARLQRLDACFGKFINYLKSSAIYDNSIVVLTSDHGDSLGEEGRWGHAFTVFPEVIRVPLIVHVPERMWGRTDPDTVAFTTDITPALYKLLGHNPIVRDPFFGMALIGVEGDTLTLRRQRSYLVASSYGPVYGLVSLNGERLYIIDAVNTAEHQYDLTAGLNGKQMIVTDSDRAHAWQELREQVAEIGAFYGVTRPITQVSPVEQF